MYFISLIKIQRGDLFILLLAIIMLVNIKLDYRWHNNRTIRHDVSGYYHYLPSIFISGDLCFEKHDELKKNQPWLFDPSVTSDGKKFNKYSIGMAYIYSPFFFAGMAVAKMNGYPVNGYSRPFQLMILLSGWFYVVMGLFYLRRFLKFFFSEQVSLLTITLVLFATNLFYYGTIESGMAHATNFALFAALCFYVYKNAIKQKAKYFFGIVICVSLLTLIRPINVICILIPIFFNPDGNFSLRNRLKYIISSKTIITIALLVPFIFFIPQFYYWKLSTGSWVYYSYQDEGFNFLSPEIIKGLFSYRKGWLLWTPLWLLLIPGLIILYRKNKNVSLFITLFSAIYIYLTFSWWCWYYGGSFGNRAMIDIYPLIALALAAFIHFIINTKLLLKIAAGIILILILKLNLFQIHQYKYGVIHYSQMDKDTYWKVWGKDVLTKDEWEFVRGKWKINYPPLKN